MKILILSHSQYQKNAYIKHLERATSLVKRGHIVTFIATSNHKKFKSEKKRVEGVSVILVPDLLWGVFRQGIGPLNIIRRIFYVLTIKFDIIHGIDCRPVTVIPVLAGKYLKKKRMFLEWTDLFGRGGTMTERSSKLYQKTFGKVESFFEEYFRKYADGNITISHRLKNVLLSLGYPENRILVLPLASDMRSLITESKESLKEELNFDLSKTYLLYVGSIFPLDAELLIFSFRKLKETKDDIKLILVGKHRWLTQEIMNELDITVTGFVSDEMLFKYIGAADIHLLPLKTTEANLARFPCKINDYFMGAKPLVTTPISDLPLLYSKYEFGVVSKNDTVEDYTRSVLTAIENSNKWNYWGNNAVDCAKNEFALGIISERLEKFYNYIIKGNNNG